METPQEYYQGHGLMSATGANAAELQALPDDIAKLCEIVQGLIIHRDIAPFAYGVTLSEERRDDAHLRPMAEMLARIYLHDPRPLTAARAPEKKFAGVCRHFSLMLASILRQHGVPARARCGFGAYFTPGKFEDHWVCEYWNAERSRWMMVDAQLDATQRKLFKPDFDSLDVPRNRFIIAGDAWQMCRSGRADPGKFGLTHVGLSGLWFIAGNVLRDLAALNRAEMLPWDVWGLMAGSDAELKDDVKAILDKVAALTLEDDAAFPKVRTTYQNDDRLRVPALVFNALRNAPEKVSA